MLCQYISKKDVQSIKKKRWGIFRDLTPKKMVPGRQVHYGRPIFSGGVL